MADFQSVLQKMDAIIARQDQLLGQQNQLDALSSDPLFSNSGVDQLRGSIDAFPTLSQGSQSIASDKAALSASASAAPASSMGNSGGASTGSTTTDFVGGWLVRATVIVLGFIFVAVGLSMFKGNTIVAVPLPK